MTSAGFFKETFIVDVLVADTRRETLGEWLDQATPYGGCELVIASADASFRRYFRIHTPDGSYVVMDSPPELEPCKPFIDLAKELGNAGINVPKIYYQDVENGFLIISDFGDVHYQDALGSEKRNNLYELAIEEIIKFQKLQGKFVRELPVFDQAWQIKELEIFREWCLPEITPEEFSTYTKALTEDLDAIPKSFMHRDFHCRNLLVTKDGSPGIIDFQGAMQGPITYDLVSLLRDCYLDNSEDWIARQVSQFRTNLIQSGLIEPEISNDTMQRWFDWVGLQRHLKCVGIFHRLKIRDGKPSYLKDIPRVLGYINFVLSSYPELSDLQSLIKDAQILE